MIFVSVRLSSTALFGVPFPLSTPRLDLSFQRASIAILIFGRETNFGIILGREANYGGKCTQGKQNTPTDSSTLQALEEEMVSWAPLDIGVR